MDIQGNIKRLGPVARREFACWCVRRIWGHLDDKRLTDGVVLAELCTQGAITVVPAEARIASWDAVNFGDRTRKYAARAAALAADEVSLANVSSVVSDVTTVYVDVEGRGEDDWWGEWSGWSSG